MLDTSNQADISLVDPYFLLLIVYETILFYNFMLFLLLKYITGILFQIYTN